MKSALIISLFLFCQGCSKPKKAEEIDPRLPVIKQFVDDGYNVATGKLVVESTLAHFVDCKLEEQTLSEEALGLLVGNGALVSRLRFGKVVDLKKIAGPIAWQENFVSVTWYEFLDSNMNEEGFSWKPQFSNGAIRGENKIWVMRNIMWGHPIYDMYEFPIDLMSAIEGGLK